ncbi:hypothetical protein BGZ75_001877 [Mortierella antarctica]|nr:hypothetical protein BGZ75_001877 [Mortierella antarctica]
MVQQSLILTALVALGSMAMVHAADTPSAQQAHIDMSDIKATFTFTPLGDNSDKGANVAINIVSGLSTKTAVTPAVGFEYHIHVNPVTNNDCMTTGGHLDPTNVGAAKCNPTAPEKCQEGDLSGKHGTLMPSESGALAPITYTDKEIQFTGVNTTIIGRSIVIHNNGTRVACANLVSADDAEPHSMPPPSGVGSQTSGAASETRVSREILWTVVGTVGSGIMAALMAF